MAALRNWVLGCAAIALMGNAPLQAQEARPAALAAPSRPTGPNRIFQPAEVVTTGSVTIGGKPIAYQAVAGTLVVHGPGWDDLGADIVGGVPEPSSFLLAGLAGLGLLAFRRSRVRSERRT